MHRLPIRTRLLPRDQSNNFLLLPQADILARKDQFDAKHAGRSILI